MKPLRNILFSGISSSFFEDSFFYNGRRTLPYRQIETKNPTLSENPIMTTFHRKPAKHMTWREGEREVKGRGSFWKGKIVVASYRKPAKLENVERKGERGERQRTLLQRKIMGKR